MRSPGWNFLTTQGIWNRTEGQFFFHPMTGQTHIQSCIFNMVTEQNVIASLVFGLIFSCSILLFLGTGRDGERGQLMDLN